MLRSRRVHAGVSQGCGGMNANVWETMNTEADMGLADRPDREESMQLILLLVRVVVNVHYVSNMMKLNINIPFKQYILTLFSLLLYVRPMNL